MRDFSVRLEKYFIRSLRSLLKCFSTLGEKFCISARPCNILYLPLNLDAVPFYWCPGMRNFSRFFQISKFSNRPTLRLKTQSFRWYVEVPDAMVLLGSGGMPPGKFVRLDSPKCNFLRFLNWNGRR